MTGMRGLIDRDIQPRDRLVEAVEDEIDVEVGGSGTEEALIEDLDGVDVVFTTSRLKVTERVLEETDLGLVAKIGTGIDNVDLPTARRLGVPVTYTPGLNALSVAEHTLALLLSVTRRIGQTRDILRSGGWRDEAPLGSLLTGKTVGIVGFGNVGQRVASLLAGFRPRLLAADPYVREIDGEPTGTELTTLDRVLEESDVVVVNAELTPETEGLIGADELAKMDDSAVLVNTARGPIVDMDALVEALDAGSLAGAGLDVFETEPLPADSPLHDFDNVVATPHTAAQTAEYREAAIDRLSANALALLRHDPVDDEWLAVDPSDD